MRIAYITKENVFDINQWSGLSSNIYHCLRKTKHKIYLIHQFPSFFRKCLQVIEIFYKFFKIKYDPDRNLLLNRFYALWIELKIKNKNYDYLIFHDTPLISFLNTNIPIILWTDLTFNLFYKTYFSNYEKFHKKSVQNGIYLDKIAFKKIRKIFTTSNYVSENLKKIYKIKKKKITVLPFASNLKSKHNLNKIINKRLANKKYCTKFLSIGVDWHRKGMEDSINFIKKLRKNKINATIDIIGSLPPTKNENEKFVFLHGFLNKNNKSDLHKLNKLFLNSHYFILLSKAEAFGLVFQEACSYAMPIITRNVGGIKNATPNKTTIYSNKKINFKKLIKEFNVINNSKSAYRKFCTYNYKYYTRNNWEEISKNLKRYLKKTI